jgi:aldehyde dehydrogenase (NAD+)
MPFLHTLLFPLFLILTTLSLSPLVHLEEMNALRSFYHSGATRPFAFRKEQLKKLRLALQTYETAIADALYTDLKKSPEETYATETGLVIAEINQTLRNLHRWLAPEKVETNLVNLPSASKIYRDPLGVVLIIAPWNYPLQLLLIPLVGAIAGGNVAVLKPSEVASATAALLEKMIAEIFPPAYIKLVNGNGAEVVPAMMKNFRFDHVFYTGSISVGKAIYKLAADQLVPVTLELGGKSPAIVEKDANISVAARRIVVGKFLNTGQTCIAPDYVLVHRDIRDKFITALRKIILEFYTSDPATSGDYGKIINEKRFDTLARYLHNAKIILGGKYNRETLFIEPTVIDGVPDESSPLWTDEIFGPILPVIDFQNFEEAKAIVARNPNPLAFYLFTGNSKTEKHWIEEVSFGGGCINNTAWHFANHHLPFGGVGNSGMGSYHGKRTFETFTRAKAVMKTPVWIDPSLKYPPFKGRLRLFKWFFR